ncbi:Abi family protein [Xanthomonas oryzae]|uniref:Abi family protein n=1 Tax=Xanthomonas oryzae TaxID=347 RepID=UPI0011AFBBC1|nr:Abi family protein [Xanthomonas oryzae]
MTTAKLPALDASSLNQMVATLTPPRLSKYLRATGNKVQQALRLYVINTKVSAAVMSDLHYIEVALRNKFDRELEAKFGPEWFKDAAFLALVDGRSQTILLKAQKNAAKHWPKGKVLPPGKVIAELTFGFWLQLTDPELEHKLWVPYLHKAFAPRKAPKRAVFNQQLDKLRQLRNRVAHHEPIFHLDLLEAQRRILEVGFLLCPTTADVMDKASTVRREVMGLTKYCRRRGL